MTVTSNVNAATSTKAPIGRAWHITLWVLQALLGVFFVVASAAPKLVGQKYAVEIFDQIGAGQWFRYVIGLIELAGGIGLLIPRLAGLAGLGLVGLMIGAGITQVFILDAPVMATTPVILGVIAGVIAWGRRDRTRALVAALRR
jgi:putative oxidoreductase